MFECQALETWLPSEIVALDGFGSPYVAVGSDSTYDGPRAWHRTLEAP